MVTSSAIAITPANFIFIFFYPNKYYNAHTGAQYGEDAEEKQTYVTVQP
jgi:hypothetical protein